VSVKRRQVGKPVRGRALDSAKRVGIVDDSRRYVGGRRFICNAYAPTEAGRAISEIGNTTATARMLPSVAVDFESSASANSATPRDLSGKLQKQVGCIYTAQGFEFDYIGVVIGDDLIYDPVLDQLKGNIAATKDPKLRQHPENFETHVKNIYRTLLTRGMKGCFVFFTNKETEKFFRRFIET
jgi:hypothetical protein